MGNIYYEAARLIKQAKRAVAFTGAGISVESGIPPFRGPNGLWSKYDPIVLDIQYFKQHSLHSWKVIKEIFYDFFGQAKPNNAHYILAEWEKRGLIKAIITQNIDGLHQLAGSKNVYEFHGTSRFLICDQCQSRVAVSQVELNRLPPLCQKCGGILRPDFVFFGEPIPEPANALSFREADIADLFLIIGSSGEIMPASLIPYEAKKRGVSIIEINPERTNFTQEISDIYLPEKASVAMSKLNEIIQNL